MLLTRDHRHLWTGDCLFSLLSSRLSTLRQKLATRVKIVPSVVSNIIQDKKIAANHSSADAFENVEFTIADSGTAVSRHF